MVEAQHASATIDAPAPSRHRPATRTGRPPEPRLGILGDPDDVASAARALAAGDVVAHGFANFYALTTRADAATVRRTNRMKGRPADQVGSVTTTPSRMAGLFDWSGLSAARLRHRILSLVDHLYQLGPCGFRGPAAPAIPEHLVKRVDGVRTVQLIGPGYACASNALLARGLAEADADILHITSANRSHHRTGTVDEPAHYRAAALAAAFAGEPRLRLLAHADEAAARRAYPGFVPTSVTVLSWAAGVGPDDARPVLTVERHGSLGFAEAARAADRFGFALRLAPGAADRLTPRRYPG